MCYLQISQHYFELNHINILVKLNAAIYMRLNTASNGMAISLFSMPLEAANNSQNFYCQ